MIIPEVTINDRASAALKRLQSGSGVMRAVAKEIDKQNVLTVSHIQQAYMSFPKAGPTSPIGLRAQTNRGRSSINASPCKIQGTTIVAGIGSNVVYVAAHEFGFTGDEQVRAHTRHVKSRDVSHKEYRYRELKQRKNETNEEFEDRLRSEHSRRLSSPGAGAASVRETTIAQGVAFVKAHTRKIDLPAREFIQRGIADRIPEYGEALSDRIITFAEEGK